MGGRRERSKSGDPRSFPLALSPDRPALRGLRWHAVLRKRRPRASCSLSQHGRADLGCGRAFARHVAVSDHRTRAHGLFRKRRDAADFSARGPLSRPAHAQAHARLCDQSLGDRADRATKLFEDGEAHETPIAAIGPGDLVLVRAGEKSASTGRWRTAARRSIRAS